MGKTGLCLQVAGKGGRLSKTPITASLEGGWDCPNQRRPDYCKPISCEGQLILHLPIEEERKEGGRKEEFQTLQNLLWFMREKKNNKKSNKKLRQVSEREKEKDKEVGLRLGRIKKNNVVFLVHKRQ